MFKAIIPVSELYFVEMNKQVEDFTHSFFVVNKERLHTTCAMRFAILIMMWNDDPVQCPGRKKGKAVCTDSKSEKCPFCKLQTISAAGRDAKRGVRLASHVCLYQDPKVRGKTVWIKDVFDKALLKENFNHYGLDPEKICSKKTSFEKCIELVQAALDADPFASKYGLLSTGAKVVDWQAAAKRLEERFPETFGAKVSR